MASLVPEVSSHLITNHVIKSAEQAFYGIKTVYSTPQTSTTQSNGAIDQSSQQKKLKDDIELAKKVIDDALAGNVSQSLSGNAEIAKLTKEVASLKLDNEQLHRELDELRHLFEKALNSTGKTAKAPDAVTPKSQPKAPEAKTNDDDFDLFGSDEEVEESDEQKKVREERLAAYAAKKSKKPGPIAKSSVILDVKPWDDETDLKKMEECVRSVKLDGLSWGAGKLIPVGYGIQKLQIVCTVEDDKVSVDTDLIDHIQDEFADYVQSVDIVAFNKI